ncbi:MAG TPA: peptidase M61 [Sphingobium sp.]|uniref:peptidase M61 n=1 Tax=Sphingobium sp. TaxID=1912891 RepID=UPI002ED647FA
MLPALLTLGGAAPPSPPTLTLEIQLSPMPAKAGEREIATIGVELRFTGITTPAGEPLLRIPLIISNVDTVATVIDRLDATDAHGALRLTSQTRDLPMEAARDAEMGGPARDWIADRTIVGTLTVKYQVPAQATLPPRGAAPPFAFVNDGGGTSAGGVTFLALPPGRAAYRTTVSWKLAGLGKGARGVSSYGEGRVNAPEPLTAAKLRTAYYMAGQIGTWPTKIPSTGFFSAWQGTPPFDAADQMRWAGTLYSQYSRLFGQVTPPPYGVFLRYNPINAGGGVGLYHSFVTTFGRAGEIGSNVSEIRFTLAHEMFHTFQPYIANPAGLASSWFAEGLATFYMRRLPLRYGLTTPTEFLGDLNFYAGRYYTSLMATVPNDEVPRRFWADTRIRTLPYDRGMLYLATVDDAIRKKTSGKRSLDDLMLALVAKQEQGSVLSNSDWEKLLQQDLGDGAVDDFHAFLAGKMPVPASDAFGPCFERTSRPLRRYELGFEPAVLMEPKRIVRGLVAGSAAAAAGLRDGDEIVKPIPQDHIQGDQRERLILQVSREGKVFTFDYLPRGETVSAYQWQRVSNVPDAQCAL